MSSNKQNQLRIARNIRDAVGIKQAAAYLHSNNWSLEAARYILLGI